MEKQSIHIGRWIFALVAVAIAGGMAGSLTTAKTGRSPFGAARTVPIFMAMNTGSPSGQVSFEDGFVPVVKRTLPAVVSVSSSKIVRSTEGGPSSPFFSDPFFRQFFGQPQVPREQREHSLGSGVIFSPEGYILTNNHVVDGATDVKVSLSDKRELPARIVGRDSKTDIAVLKVDAKDLPVLAFGDSSKMEPGDFVLAIGNPFGLSHTVTMGIVSATGRGGLDIEDYEDFIQTDAAINPGNSGGALINVQGQLVGINTAILSGNEGGGNQGIGFAIPVNMARQVMDQILKNGRVIRGYLGASIQGVSPAMAKAFGLSTAQGALVGDVVPGGPAAKAGIMRGDIIVAMNGEPVTEMPALRLRIAMTKPGTLVQLKVFRNGSEREIPVTLGELPSKPETQASESAGAGAALQGVSVDHLTPEIARELKLPAGTKGVVVSRVGQTSRAMEAGLRRGDVIQEVNHKPVASVSEFENAVRQAGKQPLLLLVNRGGTTLFIVVQPQ
jgi:serine protease Do